MSQAPETLAGVLEEQARALGEQPFLYFETREISFAEINRLTNRVAPALETTAGVDGAGSAQARGSGLRIAAPLALGAKAQVLAHG